jgi:microcystin-dependent protein
MSSPFIGQIIRVGFTFAPVGWLRCEGQLVPIDQYSALYALIGTIYGGDGKLNFALPDLRGGRVPIHMGQSKGTSNYVIGEKGGIAQVALAAAEIPSHQHSVSVITDAASQSSPQSENSFLANEGPAPVSLVYTYAPYDAAPHLVALNNSSISFSEGQAHENRQPFQVVRYAIAVEGDFPSQN